MNPSNFLAPLPSPFLQPAPRLPSFLPPCFKSPLPITSCASSAPFGLPRAGFTAFRPTSGSVVARSHTTANVKRQVGFVDQLEMIDGVDNKLEVIDKDDFVEVGLICSTHGLHGELKVTPLTDFPEERFEQPGVRWVGLRRMGKLMGVRQVELIKGRSIQGKRPSWLITLRGVETLEKATELLGTTIFVEAQDRPTLKDDEFYIPDLVGMSVKLQSSGEVVGKIVDVFNSGASDLLRVKLFSFDKEMDAAEISTEKKDLLVWIPFVEAIVPVVDRLKRMVEITPPEGLLELNIPSEGVPKKELQKQALKTKRKIQERIAGVKKRVLALKQGHILSALASSDKVQREALREQLMGIDFKLFQHALEDSLRASKRLTGHEKYLLPPLSLPHMDWKGLKEWVSSFSEDLDWNGKVDEGTWHLWRKGLELVAEGRVAVVALPSGEQTENDMVLSCFKSKFQCQAQQLLFIQNLAELHLKGKPLIPWIVVTTEASEELVKNVFKENASFGLNEAQVLFLKLSSLPYINCHANEGCYEILMESQWKIMTGPSGEGQIISDLTDSGVLQSLIEMGVDYIQVCASDNPAVSVADPVLFGFTEEQEASIGMKVTTGPLLGDHGILCLQETVSGKHSISSKTRSNFEFEHETANGERGGNKALDCESLVVLKSEDLPALSNLQDSKILYRVIPFCNYIYSVEYLKYLADQRYRLNFEAVLKKVLHMKEIDGHWFKVAPEENNAMQLRCSIHSALRFCSPSKVALLEFDMAELETVQGPKSKLQGS